MSHLVTARSGWLVALSVCGLLASACATTKAPTRTDAESSCVQGNGQACHQIAANTDDGTKQGAAVNRTRLFYRRGCERNHQTSCLQLGRMWQEGRGGPESAGNASALFDRACRNGLADGCAARALLMLENAWYCVISPEGCASILWRTPEMAPAAAEALKLTAPQLEELGLVDEIIPEPVAGAQTDWKGTAAALGARIEAHLDELSSFSSNQLIQRRIERFNRIGEWREESH